MYGKEIIKKRGAWRLEKKLLSCGDEKAVVVVVVFCFSVWLGRNMIQRLIFIRTIFLLFFFLSLFFFGGLGVKGLRSIVFFSSFRHTFSYTTLWVLENNVYERFLSSRQTSTPPYLSLSLEISLLFLVRKKRRRHTFD